MATKKTKFDTSAIQSTDLLNEMALQNVCNDHFTENTSDSIIHTDSDEKTLSMRKVLFNFRINETLLSEMKQYCADNYMTLSAGMTKAIREMLRREK